MDISLTHVTKSVYSEMACPFKRIQLSAESVVPDTMEDIGRVASVKSRVLLKSKDFTSRGISVTGEWQAVLLYITENENAVSCIRLKKDFQMDFDPGAEIGDMLALVRLAVRHTETRVLNPRKVAVTAEVVGELSAYQQEELEIQTMPPESADSLLHVKFENSEATPINAVCEKTFAMNEQFPFPEGKPSPSQLLMEDADFVIDDVQQVGSRVVAKGKIYLDICYLSEDAAYPIRTRFSTPFSQILDTGVEECISSTVHVELTSAYYELVDTISGGKALDAELHAVMQMVSRCRQEILYISDAYSNRFPTECSFQNRSLSCVGEKKHFRMEREEDLSIAEDCEDVLSVLPTLSQASVEADKVSVQLMLDVLYRSKGGNLASVRRLIGLEQRSPSKNLLLHTCRLMQLDLRPAGTELHCYVDVEAEGQDMCVTAIHAVSSIQVQDDQLIDPDGLPAVTLVRMGSDELWDLARRYHSSVEKIQAANADHEQKVGGFLLVPREN